MINIKISLRSRVNNLCGPRLKVSFSSTFVIFIHKLLIYLPFKCHAITLLYIQRIKKILILGGKIMNKRLIKIITSFLIIGVVVTVGYYGYTKYIGSKTVGAITNYTISKVSKTNLQVNVQATGTVYASITRDVVSNNSGELKNLVLKEGDIVKKGDKIGQVYTTQLQEQVDKANISLQKQKLQAGTAKTDADAQIQELTTNQAEKDLTNAIEARDKMNVTAPLSGLVVTKQANNGDTLQSGKPIISIVDTNSYKIKISVDELDIAKVKNGQKVEIKFDAIKNKVYEGAVESISQLGDTQNNVTTYGVVISIKDLAGIKLGMNASVNVLIESKENVLAVPVEALIERNGGKYVMVDESASTPVGAIKDTTKAANSANNEQIASGRQQMGNMTEEQRAQFLKDNPAMAERIKQRQNGGTTANTMANGNQVSGNLSAGNLVKVETGLENENYIEIVSGLTEGQKILITLPSTSTSTNKQSGFGGMSGGFSGSMTGGRTGVPKN
jgi:HlyD family secretion protein